MTPILHADTSSVAVIIDSTAHELRTRLLHGAEFIAQVTNAQEQEVAVSLCRDIKRLLADVEASRKAVKAPVLELGRKIDQTAENFTTRLLGAVADIGVMVVQYQTEEQARVRAEEQARAEAIRLAELNRNASEDEARAAAKGMQTEADLTKAIAAEAEAKASEDQLRNAIVAPLPTVNREAGTVLRWVATVEVLDIVEVYQARPDICRIELNRSEFNARIVRGQTVPGLKITWEQKAGFRT